MLVTIIAINVLLLILLLRKFHIQPEIKHNIFILKIYNPIIVYNKSVLLLFIVKFVEHFIFLMYLRSNHLY